MTTRTVTLGAGAGVAFAPWGDGVTVPVVMGFQGGAMITPTVRVPALPSEADTVCLRVELRNTLSDASEVLPGVVADIIFVRAGDSFEAANLFDLLGYDAGTMRGKTLVLAVDVIGATFTATTAVDVVLG